MTPLTKEWVTKAEGDYTSALRELRARKNPNYDSACFHCQQCVEKYLKARLQEAGIDFPKTHNLVHLLDLLVPVEPLWEALRPDLRSLAVHAVEVRYPGVFADREDAKAVIRICREMRTKVRVSLGIEES